MPLLSSMKIEANKLFRIVVAFLALAPLAIGRAQEIDWGEPQEIAFTANIDQTQQHYVLWDFRDLDAGAGGDCLIALHGHGSDRWQFIRQERDEVRAVRDFARQQRMLYLSPDYRAPTSWMGPAAEADLVQIIQELKQQHGIQRFFLCGGSMGGTSALAFAALQPELIAGVAAMNGTANLLEYAHFTEAIAESFGGTAAEVPLVYKQRSAEYWPERLVMPIGLTIDEHDPIVPPESVIRLAAVLQRLQRPVLLVKRPEAGHATNYQDAMEILRFMHGEQQANARP